MKKLSVFALLGTLLLSSMIFPTNAQEGERKIVVFSHAVNDEAGDELLARFGGVKVKNLDLIGAKAVILPPKAERALARQREVVRIDDDVIVTTLEAEKEGRGNGKKGSNPGAEGPSQELPWGIDRIDAKLVWPSGNTANLVKVGIIDTGISKDHPDLKSNIKGGVNTINPRKSWNDDNGHGSHVAGTVAALNNTIGVVGAGPDIDLYAIKVLGASGSGYLSDVIEGLDWAVARKLHVVNLSLGTSSNIASFHDAIKRTHNAGIVVVAAAGNSGGAVGYPAAYPEAIAVSATDQTNTLASFSSRGPEVDLSAPGVSIPSTYKGTVYATLSGTSMATPHVTGSAALLLSVPSKCDTNGNGSCSPAEVQARLEATALDLGVAGKDNLYGSGLVNAFAALQ